MHTARVERLAQHGRGGSARIRAGGELLRDLHNHVAGRQLPGERLSFLFRDSLLKYLSPQLPPTCSLSLPPFSFLLPPSSIHPRSSSVLLLSTSCKVFCSLSSPTLLPTPRSSLSSLQCCRFTLPLTHSTLLYLSRVLLPYSHPTLIAHSFSPFLIPLIRSSFILFM